MAVAGWLGSLPTKAQSSRAQIAHEGALMPTGSPEKSIFYMTIDGIFPRARLHAASDPSFYGRVPDLMR